VSEPADAPPALPPWVARSLARRDDRIKELTAEVERLNGRITELESAVRWVVTQQADDLCWMDVYTKLAGLVGIPFDPMMIPRDVMLANCERYVDSLLGGCPYATDRLTAELGRLREQVADQAQEIDELRASELRAMHAAADAVERGDQLTADRSAARRTNRLLNARCQLAESWAARYRRACNTIAAARRILDYSLYRLRAARVALDGLLSSGRGWQIEWRGGDATTWVDHFCRAVDGVEDSGRIMDGALDRLRSAAPSPPAPAEAPAVAGWADDDWQGGVGR
jgi:hypothetical protein